MRSLLRNMYTIDIFTKTVEFKPITDRDGNRTGEIEVREYPFQTRASVEPKSTSSHDEYFAKDLDYNYVIIINRGGTLPLWGARIDLDGVFAPGDKIIINWNRYKKEEMEVKGVSFTKNVIRVAVTSVIWKQGL